MRVLLVEDDESIAESLVAGLERERFAVTWVQTGGDALALGDGAFDIVLLDLGLPDVDGLDVCRVLRQRSDVPIIVLTARDTETDRVVGLELGADDYLGKPFGFRELLARIRAVLRRRSPTGAEPRADHLECGALAVDLRTHEARIGAVLLDLTPKEFDLLAFLLSDVGAVQTRQDILEAVWDRNWFGPTKTLDVHIASLRRKLGDPSLIETVRGVGFRARPGPLLTVTARIIAVLVTVTVVVLIALEVPLAVTFQDQRTTEVTTELERDALAIGDLVEDGLEQGDTSTMGATVTAYQEERGARAVIVDQAGIAVADSDPTADVGSSVGRSFATRPEIARALEGETAVVTRRSDTLDETLLVVAAPVRSGGRVLGAVRVSRPRHELDEDVRRYQLALLAIAAVTIAVAVGLGVGVGRWATRALVDLQGVAGRLEGGDLDSRATTTTGPPEVRDLADRFNAMADRLSSLVRSSQDFAADASHQLRTPLTAVRLRLDNLAATSGDEVAIDAVLEDIDRLDRTIDALLAFTRLDREPTRQERLLVGPALRDRAAVWSPVADDGRIQVVVDDAEALGVAVDFDPNHLVQVLDNLLANALGAAPAGSRIELRAVTTGDLVELHVTDHGPGLAEEDLERAFDRHWGLRPDGTGLGLAIVRRLCEYNRATARLGTTAGGGLDAIVWVRRAGTPADGSTS